MDIVVYPVVADRRFFQIQLALAAGCFSMLSDQPAHLQPAQVRGQRKGLACAGGNKACEALQQRLIDVAAMPFRVACYGTRCQPVEHDAVQRHLLQRLAGRCCVWMLADNAAVGCFWQVKDDGVVAGVLQQEHAGQRDLMAGTVSGNTGVEVQGCPFNRTGCRIAQQGLPLVVQICRFAQGKEFQAECKRPTEYFITPLFCHFRVAFRAIEGFEDGTFISPARSSVLSRRAR